MSTSLEFYVTCTECGNRMDFTINAVKPEPTTREAAMLTPVEEYPQGWSARAKHALQSLGVKTFRDLCGMFEYEVLREPNCGRITTNEIKHALATMGLTFKSRAQS